MRARSQTRSSKSSPNYRAKLVAVAEAAAAAFWGPGEVYGDVCGDTRTVQLTDRVVCGTDRVRDRYLLLFGRMR